MADPCSRNRSLADTPRPAKWCVEKIESLRANDWPEERIADAVESVAAAGMHPHEWLERVTGRYGAPTRAIDVGRRAAAPAGWAQKRPKSHFPTATDHICLHICDEWANPRESCGYFSEASRGPFEVLARP